MKLEEYGKAIDDCSHAIEMDGSNVKAYYRRALSHLAVLRPSMAVADFKSVLKLDPGNKTARSQWETTVKLIRRIEFEKAITVGDSISTSVEALQMIANGGVTLDVGGWKGPIPEFNESRNRYEPSVSFVEGMIQAFKDGGKLPKRLVWEIILGCKEALDKEPSLVEVTVDKGVKCDIVGDTHGVSGGAHYQKIETTADTRFSDLMTHSNSTTCATCFHSFRLPQMTTPLYSTETLSIEDHGRSKSH